MPSHHHAHAPQAHPQSGFGLVQMAVVMTIVGVILATILPRVLSNISTEKAKRAKFGLQAVRDEIIGYAASHDGRLPEPFTDPDYAFTVVPKPGDLADPDEGLTMPTDAWGRRYGYIVAQDNSGDKLCDIDGDAVDAPTQLHVTVRANSTGATLRSADDVAFIVFSTGPDHSLDSSLAAVSDGAGTMITYPHGADVDGNAATADANDDIVEYVVLDYLDARAYASAHQNGLALLQ